MARAQGVGREDSALLVMHQLEADAATAQRLQHSRDFAAGHAKDDAHTGVIKRSGDRFGDSGHCSAGNF